MFDFSNFIRSPACYSLLFKLEYKELRIILLFKNNVSFSSLQLEETFCVLEKQFSCFLKQRELIKHKSLQHSRKIAMNESYCCPLPPPKNHAHNFVYPILFAGFYTTPFTKVSPSRLFVISELDMLLFFEFSQNLLNSIDYDGKGFINASNIFFCVFICSTETVHFSFNEINQLQHNLL